MGVQHLVAFHVFWLTMRPALVHGAGVSAVSGVEIEREFFSSSDFRKNDSR